MTSRVRRGQLSSRSLEPGQQRHSDAAVRFLCARVPGRVGHVLSYLLGETLTQRVVERSVDSDAVLEVISLTRSEVVKHGVSLQTQLATDLAIKGDRTLLQQVILNLILNAIEAMSSLEDRPRELLITTEREVSGGVLVTVQDSGPGFDPQSVDRLFEAFYTTKPEGTGMGLAICRSIIETHGGRLWATANKPRGAVFQLSFPPAEDDTVPVSE